MAWIRHAVAHLTDRAYDAASLILLVAASLVASLTFDHYGVTWDEGRQYTYGELVLEYYLSGLSDLRALEYRNLHLYGAGFDLPAALWVRLVPLEIFQARHLLNVLVGLLGVVGAWKVGRVLGGPRTAFVAALLLLVTPRWWGHGFNNPKDIPFAAAHVWAVYYLVCFVRELPHPRRSIAVRLGIAAGLCLAVRVGGLLVIGYLLAALFVHLARLGWRSRHWSPLWRGVRELIPGLGLVLAVAWPLMLLFWPWAQRGPVTRPFAALAEVSRFQEDFEAVTLFAGRNVDITALPPTYTPHWLAITLPEPILLLLLFGAGLGVWRLTRTATAAEPSLAAPVILIGAALFPLLYFAVRGSVLYDGMRHSLFVVPPLVCLAASTFDWMLATLARRSRAYAIGLAAAGGLYLASHLTLLAQLHPLEQVYFNQLVGGLPGAYGRYETDYWGTSYREAVAELTRYLEAEAGGSPPATYRVAVCSSPLSSVTFFPPYLRWIRDPVLADFFVATTRFDCHRRVDGEIVAVVERFGVPLSIVRDRRGITGAAR